MKVWHVVAGLVLTIATVVQGVRGLPAYPLRAIVVGIQDVPAVWANCDGPDGKPAYFTQVMVAAK